MSTAVGASALAHGLHDAIVLAGLWGLAALLPHALDRVTHTPPAALAPRDAHDVRVAALRRSLATGALTRPTPALDPPRRVVPPSRSLLLPVALVASAAAAGIHAAVAPPHLAEDGDLTGAHS